MLRSRSFPYAFLDECQIAIFACALILQRSVSAYASNGAYDCRQPAPLYIFIIQCRKISLSTALWFSAFCSERSSLLTRLFSGRAAYRTSASVQKTYGTYFQYTITTKSAHAYRQFLYSSLIPLSLLSPMLPMCCSFFMMSFQVYL